jgi:hypothetical protein
LRRVSAAQGAASQLRLEICEGLVCGSCQLHVVRCTLHTLHVAAADLPDKEQDALIETVGPWWSKIVDAAIDGEIVRSAQPPVRVCVRACVYVRACRVSMCVRA